MSETIHEEEKLGKAYDTRLMRRLLTYTGPHRWLIVGSIILLLMITASELAGPYLIKVAIDSHINALDTPMVAFSPSEAPAQGTLYNESLLVRETNLDKAMVEKYKGSRNLELNPSQLSSIPKEQLDSLKTIQHGNLYQILKVDDQTYLMNGAVNTKTEKVSVYHGKGDELINSDPSKAFLITTSGKLHLATLLSDEDIANFRAQDRSALIKIGAVYLLIIALAFGMNYVQTYSLLYTAQRIIFRMRMQIFSHIQSLSFSFFDRNPVGRLLTRVTNDTETLNEMYSNVLISLFKDVFILAGIMLVMLKLNIKLALLAFVTLPLIILATILYKKLARDAFREVRVRLARINATMNENLTGMRLVHIFKREKQQYDQFEKINRGYYKAGMRELQTSAVFRPVMDFIYAIGLAVLIWFGSGEVVTGGVEFGVLYAFIDYINRFFKPINDLTEKYTIMQQAMSSSERIFMLLDEKDALPEPEHPKKIDKIRGAIQFQNVSFAYNEGEWVLRDIDFEVKPGETVAFVGATGAGKSSIISLLSRFYDIQKGSIKIDGIDIREMTKTDLRRQIGVVLQDVFLFSGDIQSNIRLNNGNITDEEVRQVAEYVNASKFIENLPNGYAEEVKERGATLSAGQRQLLAFARTLAFNPSILILDEATANIDTETELLIQDALKKVSHGRTTLIIAHRLSTIQHADKIIVLHKGKIREMGTHQELLNKGGLYYNLYQLQYKENFQGNKEPLTELRAKRFI